MLRTIRRCFATPLFRFTANKPPQKPDKQTIQNMQKELMDSLENADPTEQPQKLNFNWVIALAVGGVAAGYYITTFFEKVDKKQEELIQRTNTPTFGGNWKLYDLNGNIVTDKDMLGKNYVMYFGFTRCPDVCPAFMFKLTAAMKYISQHKSSQMFTLIPVFVSLDPEYDTPQRIQKFLQNYHPSTIGLFAPLSEIQILQNCKKQFNVFANKIPMNDTYSIDHSVIGYLMSEDGNFLTLLGPHLSSKQMASKIQQELTYIQTIKLKKGASYI